ncbi:MAG: cytochrome C [Burkholderiales bacterium]
MKQQVLMALACCALAGTALAQDVSYRTNIRPLIKAQCSECHGDESPALADFLQEQEKFKKEKTGPRFGTYGELIQLIGWPDAGAFMRRLDDGTSSANKKPGNMYRYLGETDAARAANLKLIKEWVGEGGWNLNRWAKEGDTPAISKEQLEKLKLKY